MRAEPGHQLGYVRLAVVELAAAARGEQLGWVANVTGVEVLEARLELVLERLKTAHLLARLLQLLLEGLAHLHHRARRRPLLLPFADAGLDVGQREAHLLQLADPANAEERLAG